MKNNPNVEKSFNLAKERYAAIGVDVEAVLKNLAKVPVSLHCWQGDDVGGFENYGGALTGGIMATGNYPGKARTPEELRADAAKALSLIPRTVQSPRLLRLDFVAVKFLAAELAVEGVEIEPVRAGNERQRLRGVRAHLGRGALPG